MNDNKNLILAMVLSLAVYLGWTYFVSGPQMKAEQAKLDDLVAQMNAATGPDKVDRIAAVVTDVAAMHKRMSAMMMQGMMQGGMKMPVHQQP